MASFTPRKWSLLPRALEASREAVRWSTPLLTIR
ncbi:MAG: hypothetical protein OSP8Acid_01950 [uncultured Acidilobus sp. OSP8]|nr:MAG: hypothetical protein OSP8Acid_01950 [uncultured Acidilobus sp. OSP8]